MIGVEPPRRMSLTDIFILPHWGRTDPHCPHGLGEWDDSGSIFVRSTLNPENRLSFNISNRYTSTEDLLFQGHRCALNVHFGGLMKKGDTHKGYRPISLRKRFHLIGINHGVPLQGPEGLILFSDGTQRNWFSRITNWESPNWSFATTCMVNGSGS